MFLILLNPVFIEPSNWSLNSPWCKSSGLCNLGSPTTTAISPKDSWHRSLERRVMPMLGHDQPRLDRQCHWSVVKTCYDGHTGASRM